MCEHMLCVYACIGHTMYVMGHSMSHLCLISLTAPIANTRYIITTRTHTHTHTHSHIHTLPHTVDFMQIAIPIGKVYSNYKLPQRYAPTWLVRLFGGFLGIPADMRKHMIGMLFWVMVGSGGHGGGSGWCGGDGDVMVPGCVVPGCVVLVLLCWCCGVHSFMFACLAPAAPTPIIITHRHNSCPRLHCASNMQHTYSNGIHHVHPPRQGCQV